jgi:hypothetical protein
MGNSKEDYIKYRLEKAAEVYSDAALLATNERYNSAVNRLYYACFYVVNALLVSKGVKAQTHNGVKTQFFKLFIKTGKLEHKIGKLYAELFDWRQEADYADFIDFDAETVSVLLDKVENFISAVNSQIKQE